MIFTRFVLNTTPPPKFQLFQIIRLKSCFDRCDRPEMRLPGYHWLAVLRLKQVKILKKLMINQV